MSRLFTLAHSGDLTFGSPFLLMLFVKTCLYFLLVFLSAVSTTVVKESEKSISCVEAKLPSLIHTELERINVGKLGSVTVSTTGKLLLIVVIVGGSKTRRPDYNVVQWFSCLTNNTLLTGFRKSARGSRSSPLYGSRWEYLYHY